MSNWNSINITSSPSELDTLNNEFKKLLTEIIFKEEGDPLLFYSAIDLAFSKYSEKNYFITRMEVDITNDVATEIIVTETPPEDYTFERIKEILIDIHILLSMGGKFIAGFIIEYGKPLQIKIVEDPTNRMFPYDLKQINGKG
jgi:hypothetical protein